MHSLVTAAYHPFVLKGISQIIKENYTDIRIVGQASSAKGLLTLFKQFKPDSAIIDVAVTWRSGVDLVEEIEKTHPNVELHFINVHPLDESVRDHLRNRIEKIMTGNMENYIELDNLMKYPPPGSLRESSGNF